MICCWGTLETLGYYLYTEEMDTPLDRQKPLIPGDRVKFFMEDFYVGSYYCKYPSPIGCLDHSDLLDLVVTGEGTLRGPSLSFCSQEGGCSQGVSPSQPSPGGHEGGVSPI